ncbi:HEMO protein, partial [Scopus umbretta]|nr:HEMO protein [Scopus umbretta]
AALRLHRRQHPQEDQSLYLFQARSRVWAYAGGQLRPGFPRRIGDEIPGVPGGLDAAVECHPEECGGETVLFFKGDRVYLFDLELRVTKLRTWPGLGPCSAALRWLERYYCLQGTLFQRFDPLTGEVPPGYPRDLRDYFIPCPGRGHGQGNASWGDAGDRCSGMPFQAFLSDDTGRIYAFRGEGRPARPQPSCTCPLLLPAHSCPPVAHTVCSPPQGSQVSIFLSEQGHRRVLGYPRALQEELGVPSADAAFTCSGSAHLYLIAGDHIRLVDLTQTPRRAGKPVPLPHDHVDGAMCTSDGVFLFHGSSYHQYTSVAQLLGAQQPAPAQSIATRFFQCPQ